MYSHQYSRNRRIMDLEMAADKATMARELANMQRQAQVQAILREGQERQESLISRLLGRLRRQ
jgi:hypothetical protein